MCVKSGMNLPPLHVMKRSASLSSLSVIGRHFGGGLLAVLLLSSPFLAHADFSNGAAAIDLLGQYDDSLTNPQPVYTKSAQNNGPNQLGLSAPSYSAIDPVHHRLFVSDTVNNRVLVYTLTSTNNISVHIASYVLGQANFYTNAGGASNRPYGLANDSTHDRLFVAYYVSNRVLVYDTSTISNGMIASYALGQSNLTSTEAATTQAGFHNPLSLAYDTSNNHLFVSDTSNNRVLVFSGSSLSTGMNANTVLGQADFTHAATATTQSGFNGLEGVAYDTNNHHLFTTEYNNHRVLVFSGALLSNGMNANTVLGQPDFTHGSAAVTQAGMGGALGAAYDTMHNRVFVTDYDNNRVLVYSGALLSNGMNANTVLGQSTFTAKVLATSQSGFQGPYGLTYDSVGSRLFVTEEENSRLSIFNGAALSTGMNASDVIGQYDDSLSDPQPVYTKGAINNGPNKLGLNSPQGSAVDSVHHRLFIGDYSNNRVLVYTLNSDGSLPDYIPDNVFGQPNFGTGAALTTQARMNTPIQLFYDNTHNRLFVADSGNNRVLVYDVSTITNGMNATYVLGQPNFGTGAALTTQARMNDPEGVIYDAAHDHLFVGDAGNNRVLVFTGSTLSNGMNANAVLGQTNFTSAGTATTQAGMSGPAGMTYDPNHGRLFVGDYSNNRVLVFSGASLSNGMNANSVIGQSLFTNSTAVATQAGLHGPYSVIYDPNHDRLFVGDLLNKRVLIFSGATLSTGMGANTVFGQVDFASTAENVTQTGMRRPSGLSYDGTADRLYVADYSYHRVMVFGDPAIVSSSTSEAAPPAPSQPNGGHRGSAFVPPLLPFLSNSSSSASSATMPAVSSASSSNSAQPLPAFSDVSPSSWFSSYVDTLSRAGIVSGYKDAYGRPTGDFKPGNPVTEAEILKMALLASGKTIGEGSPQNTSALNDWSAPYVKEAETLQFSVYLPSLDIHRPATRGEVIQTILEAFGVTIAGGQNPFRDLPSDSSFTPAIETAAKLGIISGDTDAQGNPIGTVRPDAPINRAEDGEGFSAETVACFPTASCGTVGGRGTGAGGGFFTATG
jgi:DNA-binding beta-propeller fold protein YncE